MCRPRQKNERTSGHKNERTSVKKTTNQADDTNGHNQKPPPRGQPAPSSTTTSTNPTTFNETDGPDGSTEIVSIRIVDDE